MLPQKKRDRKGSFLSESGSIVYDSCSSNDVKIVLGELNAKVASEEIYQGLIGRHSIHLNTINNG